MLLLRPVSFGFFNPTYRTVLLLERRRTDHDFESVQEGW